MPLRRRDHDLPRLVRPVLPRSRSCRSTCQRRRHGLAELRTASPRPAQDRRPDPWHPHPISQPSSRPRTLEQVICRHSPPLSSDTDRRAVSQAPPGRERRSGQVLW